MHAVTAEGQILDGTYRLVRLVAEGGMGLVYEATHARLAGRYAIKVLPQKWSKDPEAMARFDREARITSSLQHPNIVQVIDFNTAPDGTEYLVMEYLRGETLAARLARMGPMSLDTVVAIIEQVASGLAAAHAHGIVHRDLKPDNVLLMQVEGREGEWAKILDFGISKAADASLNTLDPVNKTLIGTPQYMAPEQCEGPTKDVGAATDQFALAAITYEMLTGRRPFAGESLGEVLFRVINAEPPPMSIAPAVESVVLRGLAKSSRARYPSVTAFAEALRAAALGDRTPDSRSHGYAAGEVAALNRKTSSRRSPLGAVLVAAVVVTVATAFVVPTARTKQPTSLRPAAAAFPAAAPVVPTTPAIFAQPTPPPASQLEARDHSPLSLPDRGALALSDFPRDEIVMAARESDTQEAPTVREPAPARSPVVRRPPVAQKWRSMTPARQPQIPERAAIPPRRAKEQVSPPQEPPSRPLPADEDAILPLDDKFNDSP